jgi:hypothetical protein
LGIFRFWVWAYFTDILDKSFENLDIAGVLFGTSEATAAKTGTEDSYSSNTWHIVSIGTFKVEEGLPEVIFCRFHQGKFMTTTVSKGICVIVRNLDSAFVPYPVKELAYRLGMVGSDLLVKLLDTGVIPVFGYPTDNVDYDSLVYGLAGFGVDFTLVSFEKKAL